MIFPIKSKKNKDICLFVCAWLYIIAKIKDFYLIQDYCLVAGVQISIRYLLIYIKTNQTNYYHENLKSMKASQ